MDVQTENTDPPPNESQPSGKIRKGFKLFGKRKPGHIFSIRSKGDGNNKSPVISSKTSDGLSESPAPTSDTEKENGHDVGPGKREQAEDEMLGEDGVLASAPARTSISSASSAKSLGFLSLLRGGRRGVGDRRVHTVSQPVGRQRRGLKGIFGNVKFRSKDKDEETPPSPLLQSCRANSVEIIKEDLTLTPKCQPRSLGSPETESYDPLQSSSTNDSAAMPPSESSAPWETTENASKTKEQMAPSPTSEPPLVPEDNSLSSLLADISSLLTFNSITGGDIMADVEAEWGKASSTISTGFTDFTPTSFFSKSTVSSPSTSSTFSTAATIKPSSVAVSSSASVKPDANITPFTKSSVLTSYPAKLSLDSTPAFDSSTSIQTTTKSSTIPATSATISASVTSSASKTIYSTSDFTSTTTAMNKAPSVCPNKLDSELALLRQNSASVSKPNSISISPAGSAKPPTMTQSPPIPFAQPSIINSNTVCSSGLEKSTSSKTSQISVAGEPKVKETVTTACVVTTKPPSPAPVLSKMTAVSTTTTTSGSVSTPSSKPPLTSAPLDLIKTPPSFVKVSDPGTFSTFTATTKTQPNPTSVPAPSSTLLDKIPPMTKTTTPVSLDKIPPPYAPIPAANTQVVSTASSTPTALGQIKISGVSPTPVQIQTSVSKEDIAATQIEVSQSKVSPASVPVPVSVSKDPSALVKMQVSSSKTPCSPTEISVSVSNLLHATADSHAPVSLQVSTSKPPSASAQIPISQPKTHPAPTTAPFPVTSSTSPSVPFQSEAPVRIRGAGQEPLDPHLARSDETGRTGSQAVPSKTKELPNEPQSSQPGPYKEKKPTQSKASGLSKIPVVGGGRAGKLPVRESQHDEPSRDPPTPVQEEKPTFNSHDTGSKDRICATEVNVTTSKHTQEESQQLQQPKVLASSTRDSKIPVKHGTQSQAASQISQTKEPHRTKIPVSKVPVRRAGNKPAAAGGISQIRK